MGCERTLKCYVACRDDAVFSIFAFTAFPEHFECSVGSTVVVQSAHIFAIVLSTVIYDSAAYLGIFKEKYGDTNVKKNILLFCIVLIVRFSMEMEKRAKAPGDFPGYRYVKKAFCILSLSTAL